MAVHVHHGDQLEEGDQGEASGSKAENLKIKVSPVAPKLRIQTRFLHDGSKLSKDKTSVL